MLAEETLLSIFHGNLTSHNSPMMEIRRLDQKRVRVGSRFSRSSVISGISSFPDYNEPESVGINSIIFFCRHLAENMFHTTSRGKFTLHDVGFLVEMVSHS